MKPIRDHVIFKFENELVHAESNGRGRMQFKETTDWGFDIGVTEQEYDNSAKEAQWGVVVDIGKEVTDIKVGDRILIEALKWTLGFAVDGEKFWRTDESCVLLIDDTPAV